MSRIHLVVDYRGAAVCGRVGPHMRAFMPLGTFEMLKIHCRQCVRVAVARQDRAAKSLTREIAARAAGNEEG